MICLSLSSSNRHQQQIRQPTINQNGFVANVVKQLRQAIAFVPSAVSLCRPSDSA